MTEEDIEWLNISAAGDIYNVEIAANRRDRYRHQLRIFARGDISFADWTPGRPPSGPHAAKPE